MQTIIRLRQGGNVFLVFSKAKLFKNDFPFDQVKNNFAQFGGIIDIYERNIEIQIRSPNICFKTLPSNIMLSQRQVLHLKIFKYNLIF